MYWVDNKSWRGWVSRTTGWSKVYDTKICVNISGKEAPYELKPVATFHWDPDILIFYIHKLRNPSLIFVGSPSVKCQNIKYFKKYINYFC